MMSTFLSSTGQNLLLSPLFVRTRTPTLASSRTHFTNFTLQKPLSRDGNFGVARFGLGQVPIPDPGDAELVIKDLFGRVEGFLYTVADAAVNSADAVDAASTTKQNSDWLSGITNAMEVVLKVLKDGLSTLHVPYSYGFAIIFLTILVKAATYPLTKKQVESAMAMQSLTPQIKAIQERYAGDQERIQLETARLYKLAGINPLAGCLPTLATIPIWIGLYRALSNVADEGLLTEGFFWIPSLSGPTTIAAKQTGSGTTWLFPFIDGHPPLGWSDTLAYLVLPVLLVISQYISVQIMQPPQSNDPNAKSSQAITKLLPLMIGYFALSVPSGLSLYWLTNNILSTAQQVWLRKLGGAKNPLMQMIDDSKEKESIQTLKSISEAPPVRKVVKKEEKLTPEGLRPGERFKKLKEQEEQRRKQREEEKRKAEAEAGGLQITNGKVNTETTPLEETISSNIDGFSVNGDCKNESSLHLDKNIEKDAEKSDFCNVNSEKFLDLSGKKEALESKLDFELDQDVPTVQSGGVCANIPNISARLVGAGGNTGDVNSERKKRKKKKVQPTAARVQDARDDEQIGNVEIEKLHAETINFDGKEEGNGLSLKHDYEVRVPSDSKTPDNSHPDLARARDADALIDTEISNGSKKRKKKKRGKKPLGASIENPGITEIHTGIKSSLGLPSPSSGHIPRESGKEEIINLNEGKDVQMKSLDASDHDAPAKVTNVLDVNVVDKKMAGNTKSSAGDCNADIPTAETENIIMEPYQADKDNGSTKNGDIKAKKRRKMKKHTTRDVQENSLVKDQQVAIEILAEKETSIGFEISEQETRHVDSPQILSHKNEEKVDMMHEPVVNTDDIAENSAKDSEGIKFKQYFVPSQNQVDSVAKGRKGTKSKRSSKKAEDNDSPSVNISTELQNSIKSIENEKSVNNSNRKHSGRTMRDSSQNSGLDDISHHSFKGSSEAPKIELKDSRHSELCEVTHQKPHGIVAAPTFENRNPSPDKPSPQKKILLAKTVSIFQDNSGESSGDENGITHSNDSTLSPSDSSSMSGDSVGEAELSQSSTSKGSKDAKEKSTSKLEMHASSKDMTIEMILSSSKRFKKAKEVASQSESQPIDFDFVPDSQAPS